MSGAGEPRIIAPILSAEYSRVRLIAICTSMAAIGARITMASVPMIPKPLLLLRLPPKNMPNCAIIEIAPASVAVIGHDQRVAVLDVRELVRDHAGDFVAARAC